MAEYQLLPWIPAFMYLKPRRDVRDDVIRGVGRDVRHDV